jgi:protease-4
LTGLLTAGCGEDESKQGLNLKDEQGRPLVVEMHLPNPPQEGGQVDPLAPPQPQLKEVVRHIRDVADRSRFKGLFLRLGPMKSAWGRAGDLARALEKVREADKPVHCHFQMADNVSYGLLARSCDRLSMTPAGHLNLVGPAAHVFYAQTLLETIGVSAELMQMGRYKGAAEPFTQKDMPPETREALGGLLDGLHGSLVEAVSKREGLSSSDAKARIDGGPYGAHDAKEAGLIDDVSFDDEAREHARQAGGVEQVEELSLLPKPEPIGITDLVKALSGDSPSEKPEGRRIALVVLEGTIMEAERQGLEGARSGPFIEAMRDFADDDKVGAVVLRIDSPGGSALASDRMWHAVRRVAKRKPVIASIGDMAASGGYYVASAATQILATPASLVGSIGVVGGKVNVSSLVDRVGVNPVVLQRGQHAAWMSPVRGFSDSERDTLRGMLRSTYRLFVRRVHQGRDMKRDKARRVANGRLWTADRARKLGLVDGFGGIGMALQRARKEAGLSSDAPIQRWPAKKGLLDTLASRFGGGASAEAALAELAPAADELMRGARTMARVLRREQVATTIPYVVRIR